MDKYQQYFQNIFQNAKEAIVFLNLQGEIVDANPAAQLFMGFALDELRIGDPWRFSNNETPDGKDSEKVAAEYMKRAYHGEVVNFPWSLIREDGREYFTEVVLTCVILAEETVFVAQITDISDNKRNRKLIRVQSQILEEIANGVDLSVILESICHELEVMMPGAISTVMKLNEDSGTLRVVAGSNALGDIRKAFENLSAEKGQGSCGSAAFSGKGEFVENTYSDHRWENIRDIAIQFGIKSCWSMPVIGTHGKPIGVIAISRHEPGNPDDSQIQILESMSSLAGMAMQNDERRSKLLEYAQQFRSIINTLPDLVFILDRTGKYLQIHGGETKQVLLMKKKEELLGRKLQEFLPAKEAETVLETIEKTIQSQKPQIIEYLLRVPAGDTWFEGRTAPIELPDIGSACMWVARDITDKKIAEETIAHLAYHDALTDLPNRALLMTTLKKNLSYAQRHGLSGAIMFMDLDDFKEINDVYGHHIADLVLRGLSSRIKKILRKEDTIARIGGDEFVLIIAAISANTQRVKKEVKTIANKLLETVGRSFDFSNQQINASCSIGISIYPEASLNEDELLKQADQAMYHAKKAGKNTFCFYEQ